MKRLSLVATVALVIGLTPVAAIAGQGDGDHEAAHVHVQEHAQVMGQKQLAYQGDALDAGEAPIEPTRAQERQRAQAQDGGCAVDADCTPPDFAPRALGYGWLWEHEVGSARWMRAMWRLQHEWRNVIARPF